MLWFRFDADGQNVQRKWLSSSLGKGAGCPYSAVLGDKVLIAWSKSEERGNPKQASLLLVDPSGAVVEEAIDIPFPLGTSMSQFFYFSNGDIGWTVVDYKVGAVDLIRVTR